MADLSGRYSRLDQMVHRVAFATARMQLDMGDLEDQLFRRELSGIEVRAPVFITSLPRAGTTALLQVLSATDEFACHTYRDMPFLLLPLLWDRLSRGFRRRTQPTERAHGDGMLVSPDAAEAFEEMIWMAGWPKHYKADRILPWTAEVDAEFADNFTSHLRKVILLRRPSPSASPRYASKNNANIARIPALAAHAPGAIVVVPVRDPVQQAASLRQQHVRFLDIHARDRFGRDYMRGIGHYEFGENLRPIDFDGWLAGARFRDATTIEFWLEYWVKAFEHLLDRHAASVHFFAYDAFCEAPRAELERLAARIGSTAPGALIAQHAGVRAPRSHEVPLTGVDTALVARARELHARAVRLAQTDS